MRFSTVRPRIPPASSPSFTWAHGAADPVETWASCLPDICGPSSGFFSPPRPSTQTLHKTHSSPGGLYLPPHTPQASEHLQCTFFPDCPNFYVPSSAHSRHQVFRLVPLRRGLDLISCAHVDRVLVSAEPSVLGGWAAPMPFCLLMVPYVFQGNLEPCCSCFYPGYHQIPMMWCHPKVQVSQTQENSRAQNGHCFCVLNLQCSGSTVSHEPCTGKGGF